MNPKIGTLMAKRSSLRKYLRFLARRFIFCTKYMYSEVEIIASIAKLEIFSDTLNVRRFAVGLRVNA